MSQQVDGKGERTLADVTKAARRDEILNAYAAPLPNNILPKEAAFLLKGILDNQEGIVDYFNHRGVSVILLLRRNHLRRLVSQKANNHDGKVKGLNGAHKAHVSSKQEAEILASYKPKLDVKRLIPALEHMERLATDTLKNFRGTRHMVVYYEDLVQNQTQTMMEVLEFLKVPQRTLISGHVKIHARPLAQQIDNWRL